MHNEQKPPEVLEIDIPRSALVPCPQRRHSLVSIAAFCKTCPVCLGLLDVRNGEPGDFKFSERYRVNCNAPRVLEITEVNLGEAKKD